MRREFGTVQVCPTTVERREGFLLKPELVKGSVEAAVREASRQCGVEVLIYKVDLLSYEKRL